MNEGTKGIWTSEGGRKVEEWKVEKEIGFLMAAMRMKKSMVEVEVELLQQEYAARPP